LTLLSFGCPTY